MFSQDTLQALFAQSGGLLPENYIVKVRFTCIHIW